MLYDQKGKILWNKGRHITGKTVFDGDGFSKTYIKRSLDNQAPLKTELVMESGIGDVRSDSIENLNLKSLLILPVGDSFFLYIDSGTKEFFSPQDYERFTTLGEILGDTVNLIKKNESDTGGISGNSQKILEVRARTAEYSLNDYPIFLIGETGTGKNHIAELIHLYSGRPGKFKVINTPGIPENLFESEMFGFTKGAFTDARCDKKGLIQEAEGGTLFIDEITEVPVSVQARLLRFVDTKQYTVLGEAAERNADVRIVAATNRDIHKAIENREFREDLYYRLNVFELELPPLRVRTEDIKDLVIEKQRLLNGRKIGKGFWDALYRHDWPGNIRELITVLKRLGVVDKDTVDGTDIQTIINMSRRPKKDPAAPGKLDTIWDEMVAGKRFWEAVKAPYLDRELNRDEVKEILERGLRENGGKYKRLMEPFNLEKTDYKNFMRFLYENRLK